MRSMQKDISNTQRTQRSLPEFKTGYTFIANSCL